MNPITRLLALLRAGVAPAATPADRDCPICQAQADAERFRIALAEGPEVTR